MQKACGICKRMLVADIQSIGVSHDFIVAITCLECGVKAGGTILESGKREEIPVYHVGGGGATIKSGLEFDDDISGTAK